MAMLHPGGNAVTDRGLELAHLKKGSKVLDVGCGDGETLHYLTAEKGMKAEGIDRNLSKTYAAKEKYPDIEVKFGDGEFLDGYLSYTFDGVQLQHCLSLINLPDEALHEAYCVLKKGGKLIVTDLYEKDPDPKQVQAVKLEADRQSRIQRQEGDCEDLGPRFVDFRFEGAFYKEALIRQIEEIGFQMVAFEDRSEDLAEYLDQAEDREAALGELSPILKEKVGDIRRDIGSFLLVAVKPVL